MTEEDEYPVPEGMDFSLDADAPEPEEPVGGEDDYEVVNVGQPEDGESMRGDARDEYPETISTREGNNGEV